MPPVADTTKRGIKRRFLAKVKKTKTCWLWLGCRSKHKTNPNRARFAYGGDTRNAAIAAYELFKGKRNGLWVLHTCDNPLCVNPNHLYLGTYRDNINDKVKRGRCQDHKGEAHPCHKLTDEEIAYVRNSYPEKSQTQLAKELNVGQPAISRIVHRKRWPHI